MQDSILKNAQRELPKHEMNYFSDVVDKHRKITIPGCVGCKKRLNTSGDFMNHLAYDVLPGILATAIERDTIAND